MRERLLQQLHNYLREQHPDLLWQLESENRVTQYLQEQISLAEATMNQLLAENQPPNVIEELCLEQLTTALPASRFLYLKELLEEDFFPYYQQLENNGILTTELINMINTCDSVFTAFNFSLATEDDRMLRYVVTGEVQAYLSREVGVRSMESGVVS